jgi:stress-induced morphogen
MPRAAKKGKENRIQDESTAQIYAALKTAFPNLPDDPMQVVYRYNPVAIRVRIISPKFTGKSSAEREEMVNVVLDSVPDEITEDITMQIMLSPREAKRPDYVFREFDDPDTYQ